jgi:hypothetical protein
VIRQAEDGASRAIVRPPGRSRPSATAMTRVNALKDA